MEIGILRVLHYFSFFEYSPTFEEIYTFLPIKTSKIALKKALLNLERRKKIKKIDIRYSIFDIGNKYTPVEYSIKSKNYPISNIQYPISYKKRYETSKKKLGNWKLRLYLKLLSFFPQIRLVGLSGSIAMMNAKEEDDIDLFIITAKNRLFTGRFIALTLAQILGLRRSRDSATQFFITRESYPARGGVPSKVKKIAFASSYNHKNKNKVCLNLFFDEANLSVPNFKKTEYVAHEILQMKPIINKHQTYEKFLWENRWIYRLFPNAQKDSRGLLKADFHGYPRKSVIQNLWKSLTDKVESLLRRLQLNIIRKHQTSEIITDTQLWFHPEDFGEKIQGFSRIKSGLTRIRKANIHE
ncbi:MAG: hypothetical protein ACK4FL_02655 [Microgenomates group bacterium]